jgi:hypothetical protein
VTGGPENYNAKFGPLGDGEYITGPNEKFAVYVDNQGNVFVARFDSSQLFTVGSVKREFQAIINGDNPDYELRILVDDNGTFSVYIKERNHNQNITIRLKRDYTL